MRFYIKERLKLLFKGKFWAFWNFGKLGFTEIYFRGKPIVDDGSHTTEVWEVDDDNKIISKRRI